MRSLKLILDDLVLHLCFDMDFKLESSYANIGEGSK